MENVVTLAIADKLSLESSFSTTDESILASHLRDAEKDKEEWNALIDKIIEWGASDRCDDEYMASSKLALRVSSQAAFAFRDNNIQPPSDLVSDGEGGVVFYWDIENESLRMVIESDGSIDVSRFVNSKLVFRHVEK